MMMISNSRKRRKIPTDATSQSYTCLIYDLLPRGMLKEVATFLEAPSRILFAIAITPTINISSPYDLIMSRCRSRVGHLSVAGDDWRTLDFGDIEEELAAKLTDDDISKVLLHIDAANKVQRLRLTNMVNITGAGLSPLIGCTSIEQIDLSLVGAHRLPQLDPEPALSCDLVCPILHSIISQENIALKHVQFPHSWRRKDARVFQYYNGKEYGRNFRFHEFLERYDKMLENSTMACCGTRLGNELISFDEDRFGIQERTCSECAKYYCFECTDEDGNKVLRFCHTCERNYCTACAVMVQCTINQCEKSLCVDCAPHFACANSICSNELICKECRTECHECKESWCYSCMSCGICSKCCRECCRSCSDKEGVNGVYWCGVCEDYFCDDCRVKGCQSGENDCEECVEIISRRLLEENRKMHTQIKELRDENERLESTNKSLWEQNTKLGSEVEELTQKMDTIRMVVS